MKKAITSITAIVGILMVALPTVVIAQPTCTLDPVFVASPQYGIWPDSATNFSSGQVGMAYAQNITIKIPLDTVQPPVKICFTRFELLVPPSYPNYNLPPGLILTGNPSSLKFPGNANSCAIISGTPTTPGTYTLHFQVDVYGTTILSSQSCPTPVNPNTGSKISTQNIDYYVINISPASGIAQTSFVQNFQLFPQPASHQLFISFQHSISETLQLNLTDITGKTISAQKLNAVAGNNTIPIDVSNIESGIYFYTITNHTEKMTGKVIINK